MQLDGDNISKCLNEVPSLSAPQESQPFTCILSTRPLVSWWTESVLSRWLDLIPGTYQRPPLSLSSHTQRAQACRVYLPAAVSHPSVSGTAAVVWMQTLLSLGRGLGPSDWPLSLLHLHPTAGVF